MKTATWLLALLVNLAAATALLPSVFEHGIDIVIRFFIAILFFLFATVSGILAVSRFLTASPRIRTAMKFSCFTIPTLWLVGSLDLGMISGLEAFSIFVVSIVSYGSWRAFLFFSPPRDAAVRRDAPPGVKR